MRNLSKKIASVYMQKQAGTSLISFPSVMPLLKDLSFKDEVSKSILEGLVQIFIDCIQSSDDFDYTSKIVNREIIEDDGVLVSGGSRYFQDTGREDETKFGALGQNLTASIHVGAKDVSKHLSKYLNTQARSYLIDKIEPLSLLLDLQTNQFMSDISRMMAMEIKDMEFEGDEINGFIVNNGFGVNYVSKNGFDEGSQHFQHGYLKLEGIQWARGNLSFLVEIEEYYHVEGSNY